MMFTVLPLLMALLPSAQAQRPESRSGWPCAGRIDPSYVRVAEATGGTVMLFRPTEIEGASVERQASSLHPATVFRSTAQVPDGVYEFSIPLDSTIESAYFFVSMQCMDLVNVVHPSGANLDAGAADVENHYFEAIRLITIRKPTPGIWTVTVAGRGLLSLIVKAQTDLRLTGMACTRDGAPLKGAATLGKAVRLEATTSGVTGQVGFEFVSSAGAPVQPLDLTLEEAGDIGRTYAGDVTTPGTGFRLAMTGVDVNGFRFQRVDPRLTDR